MLPLVIAFYKVYWFKTFFIPKPHMEIILVFLLIYWAKFIIYIRLGIFCLINLSYRSSYNTTVSVISPLNVQIVTVNAGLYLTLF